MFCCYCGHDLGAIKKYPAECSQCHQKHYKNPIPVVVCLLPAMDRRDCFVRTGVVLVLRTGATKYALPGGFIDIDDANWREAASREVKEETGFDVPPEKWKPFDVDTANNRNLLVFVRAEDHWVNWEGQNPPKNAETTAMKLVNEAEELVFPTHTQAMMRYFEQDRIGRKVMLNADWDDNGTVIRKGSIGEVRSIEGDLYTVSFHDLVSAIPKEYLT